jgi:hypothetical protein
MEKRKVTNNFKSDCPHEVFQRGLVLYRNGFTGFESPTVAKKTRFSLCMMIPELEPAVIEKVKELTQCLSLKQSYFNDIDYLNIHWTEYDKRFAVLTTVLQMGYSFQTLTRAQPFFSLEMGDKEVTFETLEKKSILWCKEILSLKDASKGKPLEGLIDDSFCEEWNYVTEEGKAFAKELRKIKGYRYDKTRTNFYNDPLFIISYDPYTLLSLPANEERPVKKQKTLIIIESSEEETEKEDSLCVICYEKEANTMVLPCEHSVVCKTCALKLETTKNSNVCVLCQRAIEHKLY